MAAPDYFFMQPLQTSIQALSGTALTSIDSIAYAILVVTLIIGVYEAFSQNASIGKLIGSVLKYVAAAGVIANWSTFFTAIYQSTGSLAWSIASQDFISTFKQTIASNNIAASQVSVFNFLSLNLAAILQGLIFLVVPLLFWVVMLLFSLLFSLWGSILFCLGPLLIASLPSTTVNSYAKGYLKSLIEWALWPVLYSIMGALALSVTSGGISALFSSTSGLGFVANSASLFMLMIQAIAYMVFMILIPFLAHFLINGSFAGAAGSAIGMATGFVSAGVSAGKAVAGKAAGAGAGAAGGGNNAGSEQQIGQSTAVQNRAPRASA
jgi:hypothetical protein